MKSNIPFKDKKGINLLVKENSFKSVENVNLDTVIAYKKNGEKHHFLDTYNSPS